MSGKYKAMDEGEEYIRLVMLGGRGKEEGCREGGRQVFDRESLGRA